MIPNSKHNGLFYVPDYSKCKTELEREDARRNCKKENKFFYTTLGVLTVGYFGIFGLLHVPLLFSKSLNPILESIGNGIGRAYDDSYDGDYNPY